MFKKDGFLRSPRSGVRVAGDGLHAPDRRNFLRTVALQGVSISALCLVASDGGAAALERAATPAQGPAALNPAQSPGPSNSSPWSVTSTTSPSTTQTNSSSALCQ